MKKFSPEEEMNVSSMAQSKMNHKKRRDQIGRTHLARACASGDIKNVHMQLTERPEDKDLPDNAGNTPLQIASLEGHADVVFGSRFLIRKASRVLYFYHFLANKALTFISNTLTNLNMTDIETGYKAFRGEIIRNLTIASSGFGFEVEVVAKIAKLKVAIYEVPISYYGRTYAEGKKILFRDGLIALWFVIRFNLFCSLSASFRQVPDLGHKPNRLPIEPIETAAGMERRQ